jgi:hypothetical protein
MPCILSIAKTTDIFTEINAGFDAGRNYQNKTQQWLSGYCMQEA